MVIARLMQKNRPIRLYNNFELNILNNNPIYINMFVCIIYIFILKSFFHTINWI